MRSFVGQSVHGCAVVIVALVCAKLPTLCFVLSSELATAHRHRQVNALCCTTVGQSRVCMVVNCWNPCKSSSGSRACSQLLLVVLDCDSVCASTNDGQTRHTLCSTTISFSFTHSLAHCRFRLTPSARSCTNLLHNPLLAYQSHLPV